MKLGKKFAKYGILLILAVSLVVSACGGDSESCRYNNNLKVTANAFISSCRKASIRQVFPKEYLPVNLHLIKQDKSARGKRAYKLLNDNRFKK